VAPRLGTTGKEACQMQNSSLAKILMIFVAKNMTSFKDDPFTTNKAKIKISLNFMRLGMILIVK